MYNESVYKQLTTGVWNSPKMSYQIFIIEDHPVIRSAYQQLIERAADLDICGEATTAREALEQLPYVEANIVLLDLSMPGTNGLELLREIKRLYPSLLVLVVSGQIEQLYKERALEYGASGYIDKLYAAGVLTDTIRALLENSQLSGEQPKAGSP